MCVKAYILWCLYYLYLCTITASATPLCNSCRLVNVKLYVLACWGIIVIPFYAVISKVTFIRIKIVPSTLD